MDEKKQKVKRKSISKKLRFEVFKRDNFTCQYCGAKAPDVLLHVDHITPVAKGGKNTLMNLITACENCNAGKGAELLTENTAVLKAQQQAKQLQERREQIEMMRDWQMGLVDEIQISLQAVNDLYVRLTNGAYHIKDEYLNSAIKPLIRKFGLNEVLTSLREGATSYGDAAKALNKLGGICYARKHPETQKRAYIKAILNNKITYGEVKPSWFYPLMERGYSAGGNAFLEDTERWAKSSNSMPWHAIADGLLQIVKEYEGA